MKTLSEVKAFVEEHGVAVEHFNGHSLYTDIGKFTIAFGVLRLNGEVVSNIKKIVS